MHLVDLIPLRRRYTISANHESSVKAKRSVEEVVNVSDCHDSIICPVGSVIGAIVSKGDVQLGEHRGTLQDLTRNEIALFYAG